MSQDKKTKVADKALAQSPDRAVHDEAMNAFEVTISGYQKQVQEINVQIREKSTGKEEFVQKKEEMKQKLDEYQKIIDEHDTEKQGLWSKIQETKTASRNARSELNDMKKKMPYESVEAIDKKIAEIEYKMQTESSSLKVEKAMMVEIAQLKQQKPKLVQFARMESSAVGKGAASDGSAATSQARLAELKTLIDNARAAKKAQMEQYKKLIEQRRKVMADMPELFEQRDSLNRLVAKQVQARQTVREEFHKKQQAYQAYMSEKRAAQQEKNRAERLQRAADREKRNAERNAERDEEIPFLSETILLEQTIAYCNSLTVTKEEKVVEVKEVDHTNPEGSLVLMSKKDRAGQEGFSVGKPKKAKKANKENKAAPKDAAIKHNLQTLQIFANLKLSPPNTTSDVPALLTQLEEQLGGYKEKQKSWEQAKEERLATAAKVMAAAEAKAEALRKEAAEILAQNSERMAAAAVEVEVAA